jgi:hypothetical protein
MQKAGKKMWKRSWRERTSGKEFAGKIERERSLLKKSSGKAVCGKERAGIELAGNNEREIIGGNK